MAGAPSYLRALGAVGLISILAGVFLISAGAATRPNVFVPGRSGGWPGWLAGPLRGLGLGLSTTGFETFTLLMFAGYLAVIAAARALTLRTLAAAVLAANLILLLGPPLISQDVFGYLAFARMGVLHGLDPYTHFAVQAPTDPIYPVYRLARPALALRPAVHAGELRDRAAGTGGRAVGAEDRRGHRAASPRSR